MARNSLVGRINGTIRDYYPEGAVDYIEVVKTLASLAASYNKALQLFGSDRIVDPAKPGQDGEV